MGMGVIVLLMMGFASTAAFAPGATLSQSRIVQSRAAVLTMEDVKPVVIGLAADSGCGKSTFMRRMTGIFGGECKLLDIGRETNTLVSDMTTVICLDDYHKWDRTGRKSNPEWPDGITALHKDCQLWDKMAEDVTNLKSGTAVDKPIYNHITGKPDFSAYVEPQKEKADIVIQVLMSDLVEDPTGKFLKVKYIQKKSVGVCKAPFLFDKGSKVTWTPNGEKLTSTDGVVLSSYDDEWFGQPVSVVEMDGKVDELEELIYVESALCDVGTKYYGELTEQMVKNKDAPGSENGTGLFQTLASFKIREAYESIT